VHTYQPGKPLSYSAAFKAFKTLIKKHGLNPDNFGLHSMRAGGATDAFRENVPLHVIDKQGRWRSKYTKYRYFRSSNAEHVSQIVPILNYI
jgi:hypothetical protein